MSACVALKWRSPAKTRLTGQAPAPLVFTPERPFTIITTGSTCPAGASRPQGVEWALQAGGRFRDMGVNDRSRYVVVANQLLALSDIGTGGEQMRGEGISKRMYGRSLRDRSRPQGVNAPWLANDALARA